ncbi:NAD(P)-dependent oxidoreductase [Streptomyces sp. NPDC091215]|uniref:NAD(P)-dependent oxidoreductase n=1 Tax=Streptomyces sp. NPDC091215 TaxID=3155192 RepID=UPI00342A0223
MSEHDLRIGFIGLGAMGRPMVENLLKAGYPVTAFDVRPEVTEPLRALGARIAHSPAELARTTNVVEIIVRTEDQVDAVLFGAPDGGVAANLEAGSVVLIHSTISPAAVSAAARRLAEREIALLDAPLTGSVKAAVDGTLSFIIGGAEAAVAECAPVLRTLGSGTIRVGEPGSAQIAKLINNMLAGVNGAVIAEGLALARAAGLTDEVVLEVVNAGTGASFMSANRDALLEMGRQADLFGIAYKDLLLALQEGHGRDIALPVTALATQFLGNYQI